jgi:SAM-dependent methyltransferase
MKSLLYRIARRVRRWRNYRLISSWVAGKNGLEIGGPSQEFSKAGLIPIYPILGSLDNSNYAERNVWSGARVDYVNEATRLDSIEDGKYDFVLACHVLEHVANPLKAVREWHRVLKPSGALLVLLPDKNYTFDHRRPYTTFEHLRSDFEADIQEDDLTHLDEILSLHDLGQDLPAGTPEEFRERSLHNFANRCLHHHVFDPRLVPEILSFGGFTLLHESVDFPPHIIALGRSERIQSDAN